MKGVIQEYQETQRTAEVSEKKQAFLQDFKEMITEAIRALKSDTEWAELDLSKYFDTLNHEILMNLLRRNEKDERVVQLIKRYLKSGVMENGVVMETEEGSPQGGNLSPLLANIYLNEFDQEFNKRGVPCIRYADDIVLLAKSERASERLLESSTKFLEGTLKLKVNREKSRTVSVFAIRNFKYLGFCFGRNGKGIYVRVHGKSWKKAKDKLRMLTSRSRCGSVVKTMERIKEYMRGWMNYYSMADMKMLWSSVFVTLVAKKDLGSYALTRAS